MEQTIYKYRIIVRDQFIVLMPAMARVMYVATQRGIPTMWALVIPENKLVERMFYVYGTGYAVDQSMTYLGSFQLDEGCFVGHLFER